MCTVTLTDYKEVVVTVGEKTPSENSESGATNRTEDLQELPFVQNVTSGCNCCEIVNEIFH